MIIDEKEYRPYDDFYFVSDCGEIWSKYSNKILKHSIDLDGYHRVDIHGKHMKVHKLVFLTWVGPIDDEMQINHADDDKNNNFYKNLYLGTQQDNIRDCIYNGHRVGNTMRLTVLEKSTNNILEFEPAKTFFEYCGHSGINGGISRVITRKWFKQQYKFIGLEKGVTTKSKLV